MLFVGFIIHMSFPVSCLTGDFLIRFMSSNFVYFPSSSPILSISLISLWAPILSIFHHELQFCLFFLVLKPHFCLFLSMRHCHMMWDLPFCTNISLWFVIFISSWVCSSACFFFCTLAVSCLFELNILSLVCIEFLKLLF